jgi:hypothetical protein
MEKINKGSGKSYNYEGKEYNVEGFIPENKPQANSNIGDFRFKVKILLI